MKVLVTGSAGFIGSSLSIHLLERGDKVVGIDNHNDYYDVTLKEARLKILSNYSNYKHYKIDICDLRRLEEVFKNNKIQKVINLAAQAGVRYSLENPLAYINSNIVGFANILEICRKYEIENLVYASTSSVYGANTKIPFLENDNVNHPLSVYAASKKSNELMAHAYSYLYKLPTTGLRFFTVYGPWGRPDMALFKFTKAILNKEPIDVYNHGDMSRDFTYIDDLVSGMRLLIEAVPQSLDLDTTYSKATDSKSDVAPFRVVNIGNAKPEKLTSFIEAIEKAVGIKAVKNMLPMQEGDVPATWADTTLLEELTGYKPQTELADGVQNFVRWFRGYYQT